MFSAQGTLPKAMEKRLYSLAFAAFQQARYQEAHERLVALVMCRPDNPAYLKGNALCLERLECHEAAFHAYKLLRLIEPDVPAHLVDMARCLLLAHRAEAARAILREAVAACGPKDKETRTRAEALIELTETQDEPARV